MRRFAILLLALVIAAFALAQDYTPAKGETVMKLTVKDRGDIFVHLYTDKAPKTTDHIVELVNKGFYNGLKFHRVDRTPRPFIAVFGDPATKDKPVDDAAVGTGGSGHPIDYEETGLTHDEGTVSLATQPKNKNSGDSQFFFALDSAKFLDGKHPVFGKVVAGSGIMQPLQLGDEVTKVVILKG